MKELLHRKAFRSAWTCFSATSTQFVPSSAEVLTRFRPRSAVGKASITHMHDINVRKLTPASRVRVRLRSMKRPGRQISDLRAPTRREQLKRSTPQTGSGWTEARC